MLNSQTWCAAAAAGALAFAAAGPAAALTVTGTAFPVDGVEVQLGMLELTDPGIYLVGFEVSRPGGLTFTLTTLETYDFFDPVTHAPMGGNDVESSDTPYFPPPIVSYSRYFKVGRPYAFFDGTYDVVGSYKGRLSLAGFFDGDTPVDWTVYADRVGDVPEPGAWALMILGFGLAGAGLRRRPATVAARG